MSSIYELTERSIALLKKLIETPSFSKEELHTADHIQSYLESFGVNTHRKGNNVWCYNRHVDTSKPVILLNSHHDTVRPNTGYTRDPFLADEEDDKLYGLGSNDAGGCLVSLIAVFLHFYEDEDMLYNFCLAATGEEEISGSGGIASVLSDLGELSFAIVGEPTQMNLAIAEKGLMVLDCEAKGEAGHAARDEGVNAIYMAMKDVEWFRTYRFPKESDTLGPIKMSVTLINAGTQHNVVPEICSFVVDVRTTDAYSNEETLNLIQEHTYSSVRARSTRLTSSSIPLDHPIVSAGISLGRETYGSPTMSDQALLNIPSLKLGPGDSARSHMADEYIYLQEIKDGIALYIKMLNKIIRSH